MGLATKVCVSDPSPPIFGANVCKAALFTGRSRVWESVPKEAIHASLPCWCDSRWDASCYLETIEHLSIFSSPILSLNLKPGQPKGKRDAVCLRFFSSSSSSSEFCFETLVEKLSWDLASLYPAKLSKQRLRGLGFFPGSLDSCKLLEICSRRLSVHIHVAGFLGQLQLFRPQLPISASQIRAPPYLEREPKQASLGNGWQASKWEGEAIVRKGAPSHVYLLQPSSTMLPSCNPRE